MIWGWALSSFFIMFIGLAMVGDACVFAMKGLADILRANWPVRCRLQADFTSGLIDYLRQNIAISLHGWSVVGQFVDIACFHLTGDRQFAARKCCGSLISRLGLLGHILRSRITTGSRFHRDRLRKVRAVLWHPHFLWCLLRLLYYSFCAATDAQCHSQCRPSVGDNYWLADSPSISAQHCSIHLRRLDQLDWLAFWIRLHSQLSSSRMDHL